MPKILGMSPKHVADTRGIGGAIRQARAQRGLSQATVAKRIGVSRSTLNHIEHFDGSLDVGILKIMAAANAVGVQLGLHKEPPALLERRLERERAAARVAAVREKHFRIAAALAIGDPAAISALQRARDMVQLWRHNRSCSDEYIRRWSGIVDQPAEEAARGILSIPGDWLNAMFQNTPFSGSERAA